MTKTLLKLILTTASLTAFASLSYAGSCPSKSSAQAETAVTEVAKATVACTKSASVDVAEAVEDALPGCCAKKEVTKVAKAEAKKSSCCADKEEKCDKCLAAEAKACEKKAACKAAPKSDKS